MAHLTEPRPEVSVRISNSLALSIICILGLVSSAAATSYVYVPLSTRVQQADVIVVGRVISDQENRHKREGDCGPHEAILVVGEVVKGPLESPGEHKDEKGAIAKTVRLRHWEWLIEDDPGKFSEIPTDERYKDEVNGIWILQRSAVGGVYCIGFPWAYRLDRLEEVRQCLRVVETNYVGFTPGIAPDGDTWVHNFIGESTHADACVHEDGDLTVHGSFRNELSLSDKQLRTGLEIDHFLARLEPNGTVKWIRAFGSGQLFDARVVAGYDGDCLLFGDLHRRTPVLGKDMPWAGERTKLLVCVSREGDVRWARYIAAGLFQPGPSDVMRQTTNAYRSGRIDGFTVFKSESGYEFVASFSGEVAWEGGSIAATGGSDWLIGQVKNDGTWLKAKPIDRAGDEHISHVARARDGGLVVAGATQSSRGDFLLARVGADHRVLWSITEGGKEQEDWASDVAVAKDGMIVASLNTARINVLAAWNSAGERIWRVPGVGGTAVEIDRQGNVYWLGSYGARFGPVKRYMPPPLGDQDLFLECYDRKGKRRWAYRDGGLGSEQALQLHLLPDNRALIVGAFDGTTFLAGRVLKAAAQVGHRNTFMMNVRLP